MQTLSHVGVKKYIYIYQVYYKRTHTHTHTYIYKETDTETGGGEKKSTARYQLQKRYRCSIALRSLNTRIEEREGRRERKTERVNVC